MSKTTLAEKFERAAGVVCRQGMVQSRLFEKLLAELRDQTQGNYDALSPLFEAAPAIDRTVPAGEAEGGEAIRVIPVEKPVTADEEYILPSQTVEAIINKFDDIAVGHCFCRQRRDLLGEPCQTEAPVVNCFSFGKSARHTSSQGFARKVFILPPRLRSAS